MTEVLLGAIDAGNGKSAAISSAIKNATQNPVWFEPVFTPLTTQMGINDARPTLSLRVDEQDYVFGVDDVYAHGQRNKIRRPNNEERYGGPDYLMLVKVLLLQMFAGYRGKERIKPTLILSVPIEQYNNVKVMQGLRDSLCSITAIEDMEGCTLRLAIEPKKIQIIPESAGALSHYAFDERSLNPRRGSSTTGLTAVVDIGFLTTNISLFEGAAYQKDRAFTVPRGGFNVVVKDIQRNVKPNGREIEISRLDRALRAVAGIAPKKEKKIDLGGNDRHPVERYYDLAVESLAALICEAMFNGINENITRVLLGGGGVYHLERPIRDRLPDTVEVVTVPTPEFGNVLGAYTILRQQAAKAGKFVED